MTAIESQRLQQHELGAALWPAAARAVQTWLQSRSLDARDAVWLLPYAALLAPARAALAALGGWQPRVETPLTLAAALGPPLAGDPGRCTGDAVHDGLAAAQLLEGAARASRWSAIDPAGAAQAVALVVDAAQALREAASACAPGQRPALWAQARAALPPVQGPAALEAALLAAALEWAAASGPAATDALFERRPAAWISLQIGGRDALSDALLGQGAVPALRLLADPPASEPWAAVAATAQVERLLCDDFESEAQAAAAAVIEALNAGRAPVALVALDRESVRRVRALLERAGVPLVDETGWRLSTTRAACALVAQLRAALPGAGRDAWLEWLKTWPPAPPRALDALEARWRGRRGRFDATAADALWAEAQAHLQPLSGAGVRPLSAWLEALKAQLARDGSFDRLEAEPAGQQVLAALGWRGTPAWLPLAERLSMDLAGFLAWVERTLEASPHLPLPDAAAAVVLTPLARACGRPFGHVVLPGADDQRLGPAAPAPGLLTAALREALGIDDAVALRDRQRQALAHLLGGAPVTLLRRARDGDEPRADSPDVEWLLHARARAGHPPWPMRPWQPVRRVVDRRPLAPPQPQASDALPDALSASQLEALRQCPYRFFTRAVLRLDEPEELDDALAKRDYGNWLHAVLHRFHAERAAASPANDGQALQAAADAVTAELALDDGELLPYRASFERFAPDYLRWLAQREVQGWQWQAGETDHRLASPLLPGLQLRGRIDRLDAGPGGVQQVLDYKTGSASDLARKVRQPLEETQLAFYAALLGGVPGLSAAYLALDDADAPQLIAHPHVTDSAALLLQHLAEEWQRLRDGAALPALGEGAVCDTCEARGLCRRDHWSPP